MLNDDSAFWRFREYMLAHAAALNAAWGDAVPPVARCDHREVLLTERRLGDVRVLWAVNDALVLLDPGQLWRVTLAAGSRMPVATTLRWPAAEGCDVLELFSGQRCDAAKPLPVDLRHAPARVFVAAPRGAQAPPLADRIPLAGPRPPNEPFAARLRDVVASGDNRTALVTAAGWDRNAFLVSLRDGSVIRQEKIGHHFAWAPTRTAKGFAVQGYDLNSAEGYHLTLLGREPHRFALYGLPKRGTSWASAV